MTMTTSHEIMVLLLVLLARLVCGGDIYGTVQWVVVDRVEYTNSGRWYHNADDIDMLRKWWWWTMNRVWNVGWAVAEAILAAPSYQPYHCIHHYRHFRPSCRFVLDIFPLTFIYRKCFQLQLQLLHLMYRKKRFSHHSYTSSTKNILKHLRSFWSAACNFRLS